MYWLWYILIGIAAGWLGSLIVKGSGSGLMMNLLIGIVGGLLGGWVFALLGLGASNMLGSLITATVGAVLLLLIASLFAHKKKRPENR